MSTNNNDNDDGDGGGCFFVVLGIVLLWVVFDKIGDLADRVHLIETHQHQHNEEPLP